MISLLTCSLLVGQQAARRDASDDYRQAQRERNLYACPDRFDWGGDYGAHGTPVLISLIVM